MKVKDLIRQLKYLDQDAVVLLASDAECNHFSKLYEICLEEHLRFDPLEDDLIDIREYSGKELKKVKNSTQKAVMLFPT